jgi:hypothetical protein
MIVALAKYAVRDMPNSFSTSPTATKYMANTAMLTDRLVTVRTFE